MTIRELKIFELPMCLKGGRQFFDEGKLPGGFDQAYFITHWAGLIQSGVGHINGLFDGNGKIAGGFAWKVAPGDFSPTLFATESWWFVLQGQRGNGLALFDAFENWCDEHGIKFRLMVHLVNLQPEKLSALFFRRGYAPLEHVHIKEVA